MVKKSELRGKRKKKKGMVVVGVNRGAWTAEEDQKLMEYVEAHGDKNWRSLPAKAGLNRCGKSCRLRWLNYLRPGIKRGNMSDDEEDLIIRLHNLLGNRWSLIAGRLPGRTDNEIKNHWNTHLSRRSVTIHDLNLRLNQKNTDAATCPHDQLVAPSVSSLEFTTIEAVLDRAHGEDDHSILDDVTMEPLPYILSPDQTELVTEEQLFNVMPNLNGTSTGVQFGRGNCGREEDFIGYHEIFEANLEGCCSQSAWDASPSDYFIASQDLAFYFLD